MEGEPQKERAGDKNQPVLAKIRALLESTENIKGGVATTRVGEGLEIEQKIRVKRKTENEETTEEFEIKKVKDNDEKELSKVYGFLKDHFGEEKMISYETLKNDFKGRNSAGEDRAKYDIYYVEDEEGKIVAARISENLDLIDENNNETNETIFYAIYIAVKKDDKYKGIGLPEQLYASALLDSIGKAINKKIICILAESGKEAEKMMKRMGFGSFYIKENDNTYKEFEFKQPALEFNESGQKTIADEEEPREHFSVFPFDENQDFAKEYFEKIYRTLILKEYEIEHPQGEFKDNEAYKQLLNYFNQLMEETLNQINGKELVFITSQQKEEMQKESVDFKDLEL